MSKYSTVSKLQADTAEFIRKITELGIFSQGGTLVLMIQPTLKAPTQ